MAGTLSETVDISCISDIEPHMPVVSGRLGLVQALARRLQTPRGKVPWWPDYGLDVQAFLLSKTRPSVIAAQVQAECLKDERVESVRVDLQIAGNDARLTVEVTDAAGPFTFTLSISEAAVSLVSLQQSA